jgi:hypothetical protein
MPMSVRLDASTDQALERIARRLGTTKSELARSAIRELITREEVGPRERAQDLIGCVSGGPTDLSERTGRRFRELLEARARR